MQPPPPARPAPRPGAPSSSRTRGEQRRTARPSPALGHHLEAAALLPARRPLATGGARCAVSRRPWQHREKTGPGRASACSARPGRGNGGRGPRPAPRRGAGPRRRRVAQRGGGAGGRPAGPVLVWQYRQREPATRGSSWQRVPARFVSPGAPRGRADAPGNGLSGAFLFFSAGVSEVPAARGRQRKTRGLGKRMHLSVRDPSAKLIQHTVPDSLALPVPGLTSPARGDPRPAVWHGFSPEIKGINSRRLGTQG